jgi:hypothetical protein
MDKIQEIINTITKNNIDDAIYTYATLLEKLIEINETINNDDDDDETMDIGSDDFEELINVNLDLQPVSVQRNGNKKRKN